MRPKESDTGSAIDPLIAAPPAVEGGTGLDPIGSSMTDGGSIIDPIGIFVDGGSAIDPIGDSA